MQTFYMIIGKDKLYLYEKDNKSFERIYVEGNPEYAYEINSAKKHIPELMNYLANEYNMDTIAEIDFVVIDNEDSLVSQIVTEILSGFIKEKISIESLMLNITKKLERDKKLFIPEYGINFDGKNYLKKDTLLKKREFSLLGYTINQDELLTYTE